MGYGLRRPAAAELVVLSCLWEHGAVDTRDAGLVVWDVDGTLIPDLAHGHGFCVGVMR
ncbi:MAG: hypothetical protein QOI01_1630 [Mycobacterium sp.]|jgi:hypothetical protein|nr:hypothetical protein [Mycobacterium sp.]